MSTEGELSSEQEPTLVVWRSRVLAPSETFVRRQFEAVPLARKYLVGFSAVDGPLSGPDDRTVFGEGLLPRMQIRVARVTGRNRKVERLLRSLQPDVIHAHFAYDAMVVEPFARRLGIPLVVTLHGVDVTARADLSGGWSARLYRVRLRRLFDRAARIVAVSDHIASRALLLGAPSNKVSTLYTGIDVSQSNAGSRAEVRVDPLWDVLFVGRLVEKKGVDDLLRAVALLRKEHPRLRVAVVGDGPLAGDLTSLDRALRSEVRFLGSKSPSDVEQLMDRSRVFVVPSKTARNGDTEGLPTTVIEAAARGMAVVATNHSGIPEAIVDGETGLLVSEGSPLELSRALGLLLRDSELRERLGRNARERMITVFDIKRLASELAGIYRRVSTQRE